MAAIVVLTSSVLVVPVVKTSVIGAWSVPGIPVVIRMLIVVVTMSLGLGVVLFLGLGVALLLGLGIVLFLVLPLFL